MSFDTGEVTGFTIAGADRKFVNAQAVIIEKTKDGKNIPSARRNQVLVWSDSVAEPVAVRYAWSNNPVCNLKSIIGLPATPFRSDDWPGVTADSK